MTVRFIAGLLGLWLLAGIGDAAAAEQTPDAYFVYVGTYTRGAQSQGIYILKLDMRSGTLKHVGVRDGIANPSFLAIHPSGSYLYAVAEIADFEGKKVGGVSAFAIDRRSGALAPLNSASTGGAGPCHLNVDATGRNVLVANYGGGSIASIPIDDQGRLGERRAFVQHAGASVNPRRQEGPHAHSINLDAANRFAFVADLGLDQVLVYRFNPATGELKPNDPPAVAVEPGSGPRHFDFHPNGKYAYVINELALTVTAFQYDGDRGALRPLQTISTVPDADRGREGLSTAEVRVHPTGKFVYGSNRGHETIVVYAVDEATGKLTHVENEPTQGKTPRNFFIDPTGTYLLAENQGTNTVVVFRIDPKTGALEANGSVVEVPSPVCIRLLPVAAE